MRPSRSGASTAAWWEPAVAGLGATELVIVLAVVLLLFGGAQLPKLARSLGQAQREFRDGVRGETPEL
jgi:sec-independent protein translocase protein TatA